LEEQSQAEQNNENINFALSAPEIHNQLNVEFYYHTYIRHSAAMHQWSVSNALQPAVSCFLMKGHGFQLPGTPETACVPSRKKETAISQQICVVFSIKNGQRTDFSRQTGIHA